MKLKIPEMKLPAMRGKKEAENKNNNSKMRFNGIYFVIVRDTDSLVLRYDFHSDSTELVTDPNESRDGYVVVRISSFDDAVVPVSGKKKSAKEIKLYITGVIKKLPSYRVMEKGVYVATPMVASLYNGMPVIPIIPALRSYLKSKKVEDVNNFAVISYIGDYTVIIYYSHMQWDASAYPNTEEEEIADRLTQIKNLFPDIKDNVYELDTASLGQWILFNKNLYYKYKKELLGVEVEKIFIPTIIAGGSIFAVGLVATMLLSYQLHHYKQQYSSVESEQSDLKTQVANYKSQHYLYYLKKGSINAVKMINLSKDLYFPGLTLSLSVADKGIVFPGSNNQAVNSIILTVPASKSPFVNTQKTWYSLGTLYQVLSRPIPNGVGAGTIQLSRSGKDEVIYPVKTR